MPSTWQDLSTFGRRGGGRGGKRGWGEERGSRALDTRAAGLQSHRPGTNTCTTRQALTQPHAQIHVHMGHTQAHRHVHTRKTSVRHPRTSVPRGTSGLTTHWQTGTPPALPSPPSSRNSPSPGLPRQGHQPWRLLLCTSSGQAPWVINSKALHVLSVPCGGPGKSRDSDRESGARKGRCFSCTVTTAAPFYRGGSRGTERASGSPKDAQPVPVTAGLTRFQFSLNRAV